MLRIRELRQRAETAVRRFWIKRALHRVGPRRFDLAYKVRDPWEMESEREQFRFAETNRLLHQGLVAPAPRTGSILEIGCGEGHQSEHMAKLCDRLTGIDVSATAIARARRRVPGANFIAGNLYDQPWMSERGRFDVITACEVLYYVKDIPRILATMSRIGRGCVVSYFQPAARVVEPPLMAMPLAGRESFTFGDIEWRIAWWRNA
jgi:2-polyprenyl-3-methyl-5-hydroxy-6-metoxy-1,4-benzoquinol methylase